MVETWKVHVQARAWRIRALRWSDWQRKKLDCFVAGIWNTSTLDSLGHGSDRVRTSVASVARGLKGRTTRGYREKETDPKAGARRQDDHGQSDQGQQRQPQRVRE